MLQNAYLLAKIGADTAENEQHFAEILPKTGNYPTGPPLDDRRADGDARPRRAAGGTCAQRLRRKYSILQSQKMKLNDWFYVLLSGGVRGRYYQRPAALYTSCITGSAG